MKYYYNNHSGFWYNSLEKDINNYPNIPNGFTGEQA